ncbi:MAG TPA: class I SAM-dependent methyltransferase, partial [Blastocatellia bacterium]|nr:class I SAM-dependent methyltransferase [Blastocatellia bacterium]
QGDLSSAAFPDEFFDVVMLWHVLEHLVDPMAVVRETRRILKSDGVLALEVPNAACASFKLFRECWYSLDSPRHLSHFTPATLYRLLGECGFRPAARWNLHLGDFIPTTASLFCRLGLLAKASNGATLFESFLASSTLSKTLIAGLAFPAGILSSLYLFAVWLFTGNSEVITLAARKSGGSE